MTQATGDEPIYDLRMRPKDVGVAVIATLCLLLGWMLMQTTTTRTQTFATDLAPITFAYPTGWIATETPENVLLRVANPSTRSPFKTALTVESRPLDPASPPTLQTLLDRRVEQRQAFSNYHFLAEEEAEVDGARALVSEFAYVVQPIDEPRRAALPVVVHSREYIIVTADQSYYVTLAAPEDEYAEARKQFDRVIASMQVQ